MHPKFHLAPNKNWCNDPVGLIYYQGNYHIFYQYFPYGCSWGTMHWRHATSKDLYSWQDQDIALYPSKDYDANGCFSGSSIEVNNKMYIYYTSVKYTLPDPNNIHVNISGDDFLASQSMIISEDGFTFDNLNDKRLIIDVFKEGEIGHPTHTRDPKVWKHDNKYYMVIVSKYLDDKNNYQGQLLFYKSNDALNWEYTNKYREISIGDMWECPDVFEINNQQILIMSPERTETHGYPSHARITTCHFNHNDCSMKITDDLSFLDYGRDLYAPQTSIDKDGNRIYIGWMRMPVLARENWRGLYTYPRVITYQNNHIYTKIHPNIKSLFIDSIDTFNSQTPCLIKTCLSKGEAINIGGYLIEYDKCLKVDRSKVFNPNGLDIDLQLITPEIDKCDLEIYLDNYIIEIYINDGYYVLSNIVTDLDNYIESNSKYEIYKNK